MIFSILNLKTNFYFQQAYTGDSIDAILAGHLAGASRWGARGPTGPFGLWKFSKIKIESITPCFRPYL
jgi:hypothetical protein